MNLTVFEIMILIFTNSQQQTTQTVSRPKHIICYRRCHRRQRGSPGKIHHQEQHGPWWMAGPETTKKPCLKHQHTYITRKNIMNRIAQARRNMQVNTIP